MVVLSTYKAKRAETDDNWAVHDLDANGTRMRLYVRQGQNLPLCYGCAMVGQQARFGWSPGHRCLSNAAGPLF